jgi:hypothetical protein
MKTELDCSSTETCSDRRSITTSRYGYWAQVPRGLAAAFMPSSCSTSLLQPAAGSTANTSKIHSNSENFRPEDRNTSCLMSQQEQINKLRVADQQPSSRRRRRRTSSSPPKPSSSCQQDQAPREFFFRVQQQMATSCCNWFWILHPLIFWLLFLGSDFSVKPVGAATTSSATFNLVAVDQVLQQAAFQAIAQQGNVAEYIPHNVTLPGNLSDAGVTAQAVRVVRHSFKVRGITNLNGYQIPNGTQILARVKRLIIVYQHYGNLSSTLFQAPPGLELLTPVSGMAVYDASNMTSTDPTQFGVNATAGSGNFTVTFASTALTALVLASGSSPRCVTFSSSTGNATENGTLPSGTGPFVCSLPELGPIALVGPTVVLAPAPAPVTPASAPSPAVINNNKKSNTWKIVLGVVLGVVGALALLALLGLLAYRYAEKRRLDRMQQNSEAGETLQESPIGQSRAPVAGSTRTRPTLEKLE